MGWKNNPKIRDLEPYCKRHGYVCVVAFCVAQDGTTFSINTYGQNAKLCKAAAIAGDQLFQLVHDGKWPDWPESEPKEKP